MTVTFLAHSGFFVELDSVCLLLDWWKGDLPEVSGKPLFCFASHRHSDHFDPRIFALDDGAREVRFLLGRDIRLTQRHLVQWGLRRETAEKCFRMGGGETLALPRGVTVETLPSTDAGVAFLISCEGKTLYHAGDLNWWRWAGEDPARNRNMEVHFKRYMEPLRGRKIDLAFAPLDPRQGGDAGLGLEYLLELAEVARVIPMHQWEDGAPTEKFRADFPQYAQIILPAERPGQSWTL